MQSFEAHMARLRQLMCVSDLQTDMMKFCHRNLNWVTNILLVWPLPVVLLASVSPVLHAQLLQPLAVRVQLLTDALC